MLKPIFFLIAFKVLALSLPAAEESLSVTAEPFFDKGRKPLLNIRYDGKKDYSLKITDLYTDKVIHSATGTLEAGKKTSSLILPLPYGAFQVEFKSSGRTFKKNIVHFMPEALSSDPAVRAYEYEYSPLGGVFGKFSPEQANVYGASWIRFEHPNWRNNETEPGKFDFTQMRKLMESYVKNNVRPVILQTLYHYPKFISFSKPEEFAPGYGRHLQKAAAALDGLTRYFELGNEDNGHTKFIYTEICRHAAAGIRASQPFAVLANSGTAYVDHNWLEFQSTRGLQEILDAYCVHPYTNNSTPSQSVGPEKSGILEKLERLHELVDAHGGMKQLWSTEYGWPNSKLRKGEHDRADLYVREMLIGEMAVLDINGLYTWNRDYGIAGRPAGVAIQTYARMREGRRFSGFFRKNDIYVAVYEKNGDSTAVVWTADNGFKPNPVKGGSCFDLFGNPLKENNVRISQSPVYIRNAGPEVLRKAVENSVARAWKRYKRNLEKYSDARLSASGTDSQELCSILKKWSRSHGTISKEEQAVIASLLHLYLNAARYDRRTPDTGNQEFAERRKQLESTVIRENAALKDVPSVRYLLNLAARMEAEAAMSARKENKIQTLIRTVYLLADRFARDGERIQYAVFAHICQKRDNKFKERLSFIPGREQTVTVRVSSYAKTPQEATVHLILPDGWKAEPEKQTAAVSSEAPAHLNFKIKCPVSPAKQNVLKAAVKLKNCPPRITTFNDLEIIPAVTVEASPVSGTLPGKALELIVQNQESKQISGNIIILDADGNQELARLELPELAPFQSRKLPVKLRKLNEKSRTDWEFTALFLLNDKRRFEVPFNVDFLYAAERKAPLKIDSKLEDWDLAFPLNLNKAKYTLGSYGDAWSEKDCSAKTWLMWDHDKLYFAAAVRDQTFNQQYTGDSTWQQDSIQIIFADPVERKPFEITFALTPEGPQAWSKKLLKNIDLAVEYRDNTIYYEAAIPWTVFPGELKKSVGKHGFLYGIAVNDDDAIVSRRYLERFKGSIVHGKKVDAFAPVTLGPKVSIRENGNTVFFEDFSQDKAGTSPLRWINHSSGMKNDSNIVISAPDASDGGKALRLRNPHAKRPHHFSICIAPLSLEPGRLYELSARMKQVPENSPSLVGICADLWGNKSQRYLKTEPSPEYKVFQMDFTAPLNGKLNIIIRNTVKTDDLQIDWIKVRKK